MTFNNTSVYNIYNAVLGARNPMNSWNRSDSVFNGFDGKIENTTIGKNDLELMQKLIKAGSEHRKFLRQIMVSVDITAPLYFFKEFDQYKIGTTSNSTSTMHKLASTPITMDCFEMGDFENMQLHCYPNVGTFEVDEIWKKHIENCEKLRLAYVATKDKRYWKELIRLLPTSWLQTRTITMNYENILNMYHQRKNHKLTEWSIDFINWVKSLPYAKELLGVEL